MTHTARTKEEEREFFDSPEELEKKVTKLAKLIENSKHFIAFTGAGISTSCGIPDFRSGVNTVLETGAGAWAKGAAIKKGIKVKAPKRRVNMLQAIPSPTHMALVQLAKEGLLKGLISQNVDGLHRRSGFPPEILAELHGNTNLESCDKCGKQYLRDFSVRNARGVFEHKTGRKCVVKNCNGNLCDTIINFGENLPEWPLDFSEEQSTKADVCLAVGSSLTVTPAANFPEYVGKNKKAHLIIINLQKTPLDRVSSIRIYAKCDDVIRLLMKKLNITIPNWKLIRYSNIQNKVSKNSNNVLSINGIESDNTPAWLWTQVSLNNNNDYTKFNAISGKFTRNLLGNVQFKYKYSKVK